MLLNCPSIDTWHKDVPSNSRGTTIVGISILLLWVFGFGAWAGLAPLDGAVIAPGSFVATGQNKQIQHLEGGIIDHFLVKEGDLIERGATLLRMDDTAAKANLRRMKLRYYRLLGQQGRLRSESSSKTVLQLPDKLLAARSQPQVLEIIQGQKIELNARLNKLNTETLVLRKEIRGLVESISGFQSQVDATNKQITLFDEELADKQELLDRALTRKTEVLAVRRATARLTGELGQLMSRIADSRERIARAEQQIAHLQSTAIQKAVEELRLTETELYDVIEQIRAATDVMSRIEVRAPVRGIIVKLNHHTSGGVVAPGAVILEMLPVDNELIIEARILPSDITKVEKGQSAQVRLSALNQRLVPMINAAVIYVSADAINAQAANGAPMAPSAQGTFVVRVRLQDEDLRQKAPNFKPTPGMPAEIFVKTGERTFFDYLLKPILDSFSKAFRES